MYVKQVSPLAIGTERTYFRCAPLSALRHRWHYLMRQVSPQSCCTQCGLPHCSPPYLLPHRASRECQILTLVPGQVGVRVCSLNLVNTPTLHTDTGRCLW